MQPKTKVSVSYNSRLKRVRVHFTVADCQNSRKVPDDILSKAEAKLQEELEDGHIEYFEVFHKKIQAIWTYCRDHAGELPGDQLIKLTLAQGARAYSEIQISRSHDSQILGYLSCKMSERRAKSLYFNAFVFHVLRLLKEAGIAQKPDSAQLRFFYLAMKAGMELKREAMKPRPVNDAEKPRRIAVEIDEQHRFASLHIFDGKLLLDKEKSEKIYQKAIVLLNQWNESEAPFTLLHEHTVEKLQSLQEKPQAIGFNLPYSLLLAYNPRYQFHKAEALEDKIGKEEGKQEELAQSKKNLASPISKGQSEVFELELSQDKMLVKIKKINHQALAELGEKLSPEWIIHQLHRHGIVFGYDDYVEEFWQALKLKQFWLGKVIAKGLPAEAGQQAYLHEFYRYAREDLSHETIDMRAQQNPMLATAGQLIAEVRFEDGRSGRNVLGQELFALGSAHKILLAAGQGVALREQGRFFAKQAGLIERGPKELRIVDVYVHPGDINLASGHLSFKGSVLVKGSIEAGSEVRVHGSLLVEGMIAQAQVRVEGSLEVQGGIITGPKGYVKSSGDCRCRFIENSQLEIAGTLRVAESVLSSQLVVGKDLLLLDKQKSSLSGGKVCVWQAAVIPSLGTRAGQKTLFRLGVDYYLEVKMRRWQQRLANVEQYSQFALAQLNEMADKSKNKKDDPKLLRKHWEKKRERALRLIESIKQRLAILEQSQRWNPLASLRIAGILDASSTIEVSGKRLALKQNVKGVFVSSTPFRGTCLHDLEYWPDFQEAYPDLSVPEAS